MRNASRFAILAIAAALAVALPAAAGAAGSDTAALHASAELRNATGDVVGWARFTEDAAGILHVNAQVRGLPEGLHGIHIHAVGACAPTFAAAGGHHNPLGVGHGLDSDAGGHAGDLPNLSVNVAGAGHLDATSDRATLSAGTLSVFDGDGSALVIHAGQDDQHTDPTGNSGGRIACGVIVAD
ncbi:MAG: superoxide dismutase family protein [Candidatus Limnocylindrales bacterium]